MNWLLNDTVLQTPSGTKVRLEAEVFKVIPCSDVLVVVLKTYGRADNVLAINCDGSVRWRFIPKGKLNDPFVGGWCEGENVRLDHPDGYAVTVNLKTGSQVRFEQMK